MEMTSSGSGHFLLLFWLTLLHIASTQLNSVTGQYQCFYVCFFFSVACHAQPLPQQSKVTATVGWVFIESHFRAARDLVGCEAFTFAH